MQLLRKVMVGKINTNKAGLESKLATLLSPPCVWLLCNLGINGFIGPNGQVATHPRDFKTRVTWPKTENSLGSN